MKLCVVSGSRAEWGLLEPLCNAISKKWELSIIATGSHLSKQHGYTVSEINYPYESIEILLVSDTPVAVSKAVGLACISFSEAYERLKPDAVILLGDRFEILSAAIAAHIANIKICHIHGGELTAGSIDDAFRHSITHMSQLHFTAAEPYRQRVIQLGQHPDTVFNVGALGCDGLEFVWEKEDHAIFLFHSTTLDDPEDWNIPLEIINERFDKIIYINTNADPESYDIRIAVNRFVGSVASLPRDEFINLLSKAKCIVGNSSAGIIEAPCLGTPTINVGSRQDGRLKAMSVIDCDCNEMSIAAAFGMLESSYFKKIMQDDYEIHYRGGNVAEKILNIIEAELPNVSMKKGFYDLP